MATRRGICLDVPTDSPTKAAWRPTAAQRGAVTARATPAPERARETRAHRPPKGGRSVPSVADAKPKAEEGAPTRKTDNARKRKSTARMLKFQRLRLWAVQGEVEEAVAAETAYAVCSGFGTEGGGERESAGY